MERSLVLGHVGAATLFHGIYLAVVGAIGVVVASRRLGQLLLR